MWLAISANLCYFITSAEVWPGKAFGLDCNHFHSLRTKTPSTLSPSQRLLLPDDMQFRRLLTNFWDKHLYCEITSIVYFYFLDC